MKQIDILNMPHLKVAEVKEGKFVHVHVEDGFRITSWIEADGIQNYTSSVCMYMPIRDEYDDDYRIITVEEHDALDARQREYLKNELNDL